MKKSEYLIILMSMVWIGLSSVNFITNFKITAIGTAPGLAYSCDKGSDAHFAMFIIDANISKFHYSIWELNQTTFQYQFNRFNRKFNVGHRLGIFQN